MFLSSDQPTRKRMRAPPPPPAGTAGGGRRWQNLSHGILLSIFSRLPAADMIVGVCSVCSSWRSAARDPHCWRCLDLRDWCYICRRIGGPVSFDCLFERILSFAGDQIESIYFPCFADCDELLLVSRSVPNLKYFSLPNYDLDEDEFSEAISNFKSLKGMGIDSSLLKPEILEEINNFCPNLSELKIFTENIDCRIASNVCAYLPDIKKLEIINANVSPEAIITFLDHLVQLEYFDISGNENSVINDVILEKAKCLKVFLCDSNCELEEFLEY